MRSSSSRQDAVLRRLSRLCKSARTRQPVSATYRFTGALKFVNFGHGLHHPLRLAHRHSRQLGCLPGDALPAAAVHRQRDREGGEEDRLVSLRGPTGRALSFYLRRWEFESLRRCQLTLHLHTNSPHVIHMLSSLDLAHPTVIHGHA